MPAEQLEVSGIVVVVVRKPIKNLHLSVHPPDGRVRVSAPEAISTEAVKAAVVARLAWIKRRQERLRKAPRQSPREMVSGETHYFDGQRYLLRVESRPGPARVHLGSNSRLVMQADPRSTRISRLSALNTFYRQHLNKLLPELIAHWVEALQFPSPTWSIRSMKTHWGSANPKKRSIVLNLELAKQPRRSVDYVVLHELVHLVDRTHSKEFQTVMDKQMPDWRDRQSELNASHSLWR